MFSDFCSSRPVIAVPVDAGDDGVVVTRSIKTLRIGVRSGLVILGLARVVIPVLVGEMIGVIMLAEFDIVVAVVEVIVSEVFVAVSCVGDVRAGVWTGEVIGIDVAVVTRVDMEGVLIDLLTGTVIDFVTESGVDVLTGVDANMVAAVMTDLEFIPKRVSLEV